MAIVFVSPKEKQKVFILIMGGVFLLFLVVIGLGVFLAKPKQVLTEEVFQAPKIEINFDILKSDKVKDLEPLPTIENEYNYKAETKKGEKKTGRIAAWSQENAKQILTDLGFSNITLEIAKIGRENPFTPYYEIKPPAKSKTKKK